MAQLEFVPNQAKTEAITAHVLWMTVGLSCEGDSVAMTSATNPSLEDIITGRDPRDAEGRRPQPGPRLRAGPRLHAGLVRRRAGQARPVRARHRGLARQREDQRRRPLDRLRRQPGDGPADHDQRVGRPARAEGRGGRRGRHLRHLRRHPGDEEQPDGRDGPARLPRLELEVQGRHPDRQHPGLPGAAGQHDRDADAPRVRARGHGAGARARRRGPAGEPVRPHRARELQPRGVLRARATSPPSTAPTTAAWSSSAARARWSSATCRCAAGRTDMGGCPNVGGICMACTMPGFPDKYMPFMDEDPNGKASSERREVHLRPAPALGAASSRSSASTTRSPSGGTTAPELTTGYQKRW